MNLLTITNEVLKIKNVSIKCVRILDIVPLENGKFKWPRNEQEAQLITSQQFRWLMEGLHIEQPKRIQKSMPKKVL